ncbi:ABC transporter [Pleomorphomonas diazotrophica]|uniref:ABC transporter n=1 Tax=Pleomorphomonas diazotrophica TaxID=1166257 RepID=A0A1I4VSU0_9HYPH|nr:ABC transporter permease [Pleomorphomonas diazotrophica]PKR89319.1 ABC transporter [Pleomorphomonas diazotrophica]SFN04240.1 osmoprotectant transport system permease protein [Pleomorphomonas diazotrophica]
MTRYLTRPGFILRFVVFAALLAFLLVPDRFAGLLAPLTSNGAPAIYNQGSLIDLTLSHLFTVALSTFAAAVVAVGLAIFVTRPAGAEFLALSRAVVNIGQTFPPVAVLALSVPAMGFGEAPTRTALFLYGLLPIFENTLTGLSTLPPAVVETASAMGMTGRQRLLKVELPLALPLIVEGIRLSAVIGLATATIGSTVAAKGLGEVIIAGLLSNNLAFIVQGGVITGILAVLISDGFQLVARRATRRRGAPVAAQPVDPNAA